MKSATTKPLWRVGKKLGRTIYIGNKLVGLVDNKTIANQIVKAMNQNKASK